MQPLTIEKFQYDDVLESAVAQIGSLLDADYAMAPRAIALLLLQGDEEVHQLAREREGKRYEAIGEIIAKTRAGYDRPLNYVVTMRRQQQVSTVIEKVVKFADRGSRGIGETLSQLTMSPITGFPLLIVILYFGLYQFVGVFGASTLVNFLEAGVFQNLINPLVTSIVDAIIPWPILQSLFVGEYGIITLGVRYAVAIILPIVGTFFIAFSIMEDTGYFPRLAMLIDRLFKAIGLNGRAVIPMVLGFGCDTMATMVTRVLETKRERVIATILLALAVPCSAQLGVILALLSFSPRALFLWAGVVTLIFLLVGFLSSKLMPGEQPSFYMEVPPLRLPNLRNVLTKTYTRMEWYFFEVFPLFVIASVIIWVGQITGLFDLVIGLIKPLMQLLGLPDKAAVAFFFGFFRRDYGAAGLFDLKDSLTGVQMVVASVTLTLFIPCIAQFSMMLKERGTKMTLAIVGFIFPFAFLMGYLLNLLLTAFGVQL